MSSFPNLECDQNKGYLVAQYLSRSQVLAELCYCCLLPGPLTKIFPLRALLNLDYNSAGLEDRYELMVSSIRYAMVRERIAVLSIMRLATKHNNGFPLASDDQQWETYVDLENVTAIFRRQDDNTVVSIKPVKVLTLSKFLKRAWLQLLFRRQPTYHLDHLPYEDESAILKATWKMRGGDLIYRLSKEYGLTVDIQIPPSQKVKSIAQDVIDKLRADGDYCVLHIRRGDRVLISDELLDRATQPGAIMERIKDIFPEGAVLYIMTDEQDRTFFDPLKVRYRVRRYFDFRELAKLVHGKTPNNHLLYAVEKQIASQSSKECRTFVDPETIQKNIPTLIDKERDSLRFPRDRRFRHVRESQPHIKKKRIPWL